MLTQVLTPFAALITGSILAVKFTDWYSKRCVAQSMAIVQAKLREFETIANTYTENGTPDELQAMIESLEGIQNLTGLTYLNLWGNSISAIGPLSALTSLTYLDVAQSSIADITALGDLTSLTDLYLNANSITERDAL